MINKYLTSQIKTNFPFVPTNEQEKSLEEISMFILSGDDRRVFLLCGYAGTGKTSLVAALVKTMEQLERRTVLTAVTGTCSASIPPRRPASSLWTPRLPRMAIRSS